MRRLLAICVVAFGMILGTRVQTEDIRPVPPVVEIEVNQTSVVLRIILRSQKIVGVIWYAGRIAIWISCEVAKAILLDKIYETLKIIMSEWLSKNGDR